MMNTDRREFIKNLGIGGIGAVVLAGTEGYAHAAKGGKYGVLVDARNCVNCKACQISCKMWNGNEPDPNTYKDSFTSSTFCWVQECKYTGSFPNVNYHTAKRQCMHCEEPACVEACPQDGRAIHKEPDGIVLINHENCIRCESCTDACSFGGVPRLDEDANMMKKCTFCVDRVRKGIAPACVDTCIAEALKFGTLKKIKKMAKKAEKQGYPVYGLGKWATSWVYVYPKGVKHRAMFFPRA